MTELNRRIAVTLGALVIYRLGAHIPLPGVDLRVLQQTFAANSGGLRGVFDMAWGSAVGRISILALGVAPYITASIWLLLGTAVWQRLRGRQLDAHRVDRSARIVAVALAVMDGYGSALALEQTGLATNPGAFFEASLVVTLAGGTIFLIWLADQITRHGVGNGIAVIFFFGIVGRLPRAVVDLVELGRSGARSPLGIVLFLVLAAAVVAVVVFIESAQRRIPVLYRLTGGPERGHLSLKPNGAGIIPAIFASSLVLVPTILARSAGDEDGLPARIMSYLSHGHPGFLAYYGSLIVFFAFLYVALLVNPKAMAAALGRYGGTVDGQAPGETTARYLGFVRNRLTLIGALYLAAVCLLPEALLSCYGLPFYFGGSGLLVVVCVALDVLRQIRAEGGWGLPDPAS